MVRYSSFAWQGPDLHSEYEEATRNHVFCARIRKLFRRQNNGIFLTFSQLVSYDSYTFLRSRRASLTQIRLI